MSKTSGVRKEPSAFIVRLETEEVNQQKRDKQRQKCRVREDVHFNNNIVIIPLIPLYVFRIKVLLPVPITTCDLLPVVYLPQI